MHATRVVTFLLGAWLIGTLFVDSMVYTNLRLPEEAISGAPPDAENIIKNYGPEQAPLLLHYYAGETNQYFLYRWELIELGLGLILLPCVFAATERKVIPLVMASFLLILALAQFFVVSPELAYRGREVAFPPGKGNVLLEARLTKMWGMFAGTEGVLVVVGGALAGYVASYKTRRRATRMAALEEELAKRG